MLSLFLGLTLALGANAEGPSGSMEEPSPIAPQSMDGFGGQPIEVFAPSSRDLALARAQTQKVHTLALRRSAGAKSMGGKRKAPARRIASGGPSR